MKTPGELSFREGQAVLKTLGRSGVAELVNGLCAQARNFASLSLGEGFQILNDVVFNQVLVSCGPDDGLTSATLERLQRSGEIWCGGSTWHGKMVIRISVCSWATTDERSSLCCGQEAGRQRTGLSVSGCGTHHRYAWHAAD